MELKFKVAGRIARPVAEVFEAVVNPAELSRYFKIFTNLRAVPVVTSYCCKK